MKTIGTKIRIEETTKKPIRCTKCNAIIDHDAGNHDKVMKQLE